MGRFQARRLGRRHPGAVRAGCPSAASSGPAGMAPPEPGTRRAGLHEPRRAPPPTRAKPPAPAHHWPEHTHMDLTPYRLTAEPYYHPTGHEIALYEHAYAHRLPLVLQGSTGCGKTRFIDYM